MMHGPCGTTFPNCPCMTNGKCSKNFPKEFNSATSIDYGSYPKYERPDNGNFILKNGIPLDNRWVVPYNPFLLKRYQAHINVEVCSSVTAVKYLYKYVYKGHDRIIVEFTNSESNDEVSKFVDARYVSASEAAWRIFHFELHDRYPSIQRLALHLPNEQIITYTEGNAQTALDNRSESTLMAWFKINAEDVEARQLFYHEFPERYTYVNGRGWRQRRRNVKSIGRIYQANPIQGERFYLRLLLHHVRGATSFDDLKRQPGGSISNTFREAAYGLGLLEHDEEWLECLDEAAQTSMPFQMRQLFALILLYGEPSNPMHLWTHFEQKLCEDFLHNGIGVEVSSNRALSDIQNHLNAMNKSLQDYGLPTVQINDGTLTETIDICNPLEQERLAAHNKAMFNEDQMHAFNTVMLEVNGECSHNSLFFLDGPGGSGKTFFYNTLIAAITGQSKKVIAVASSGIAAELLQGGRTAHSALKIPIPIHENSICSISRNSSIANLIRTCSLLVWDEAPMTHRHVFECVDRTFRDLLNIDSPFGGIVVLLGGDFRQILPVVRHGSEGDIVNASLKKSYLWSQVKKLHLTINMRAQGNDGYHEWLISVGNGDVENIQGQGNNICLPPRILETDSQPSTLIQTVYSNVETEHGNDAYLRDRAILTTKNEFVDRINDHIISKVPGEFKTYLSADSIADEEGSNLYPVDFLNTLNLSGLPPHCLRLKENTPVMLLRNLNPKQGLLNGTRLKVKKLGNKMIEAQIISGKKSGTHVFIPRITLIPSDADIPFILRRRQFPIRPCYAMTINKAQGQTIQHIGVYLPYPVFSHGQLYVALSRCHNFDSLRISVPDCHSTANVVYKCILQN